MRYIKLWDGIASDWRYSKSPYHMHLFIHCLLEAWHADAKEFKRGTFRSSYRKLEDQTGISRKKIIELLKDLSIGDNPEIIVETKKGYTVGYTEITVLNYDKYQSNVSDSTSKVYHSTSNVSNSTSKVSESTSKVSHSASNVSLGHPKEEEEKKEEEKQEKQEGVLISSPTDVGSSFEDLIQVYPGKITNGAEAKAIFNNLSSTDKQKCVTFANQLKNIWDKNGNEEKRKYIKGLYRYIDEKLFNGVPTDVLPQGTDTELPSKPIDSRTNPEFIEKFGKSIQKGKTLAEIAEEKVNSINK
jgi:hypothetical protein